MKKIRIIDETIREGMQFRGLMFSFEQRFKILQFQEKLGVDICQVGYPPAHIKEADLIRQLCHTTTKKKYQIKIAAMGRATLHDVSILLDTKIDEIHLHLHIPNDISEVALPETLNQIKKTISFIKEKNPNLNISIAMLDIGKTDINLLQQCLQFLNDETQLDIISLPDTSGIMAPNQIYDIIHSLSSILKSTQISIHCHNDLGMASANGVMGILAGGTILEASALGIGERNGISDLYTTTKVLKDQGFKMNLDVDDLKTFQAYYNYINEIVYEQTGNKLLSFNTPVFGDAMKTHVAGTHSDGRYGQAVEERFYLNMLCGKHLVKKFLMANQISFDDSNLSKITKKVKTLSFKLNRSITPKEVEQIVIQANQK